MTLANRQARRVRSLGVVYNICHHEAVLNVDDYGDAAPVPTFGPRMSTRHVESSAHSLGLTGKNALRRRVVQVGSGSDLDFARRIVANHVARKDNCRDRPRAKMSKG